MQGSPSKSSSVRAKEFTLGGLFAVTGANVGWGITDVCIAIIGRGQVVTWLHGVLGAIFLICVTFILREKLQWKHFIKSFPVGLQRAVVWSAMFIAFQEDNPSIAITILSFSLVVSIIVFGPRLGEKLTPQILLLALVGTIGLILTSVNSFENFSVSKGALLSLIVLPVASAGTYVLRNVQKQVPIKTTPAYMYIWVGLLTSVSIPFINPQFGFTNHEIFVLVILTVFGAGGHLFFNYSQAHTTFRFNAIASTIHSPATAIFALWFIGDTLRIHQVLGIVIVTVVVAYMSISTRKPKVQELEESLVPDI